MNPHPVSPARLGWSLAAAIAAMPFVPATAQPVPPGPPAQPAPQVTPPPATVPQQSAPVAPASAAAPGAGWPVSAPAPTQVTDWINRTYPADREMPVMAAPTPTAGVIGNFRAGADVLVLGVVAGGEWLQIRLPDGVTLGYVRAADFPRALGHPPAPTEAAAPSPVPVAAAPAAQLTAPAPPPAPAAASVPAAGAAPPRPVASLVPVLARPTIAAPEPPAPEPSPSAAQMPGQGSAGSETYLRPLPAPAAGEPSAPAAEISGSPQVIDSATLLVNGQLVPLFGVQGLDGDMAAGMAEYIAAGGNNVMCRLREPPRYSCVLPGGADVAMAGLINGAALLGPGAPDAYVAERDDAVRNRRGIWSSVAIPAFTVPPALPPALVSPYLAWMVEYPLWPVEMLAADAYVIDGMPWGYIDGGWQAMAYDPAAGGWGFHGADGGWHGAPGGFGDRFDHRFPHGAGMRGGMMHAGLRGGFEHGREGFRGAEGFHGAEGFRGGMAGHPAMHEAAARGGFAHPHMGGGFGAGRGGMGMDRAGFAGAGRGGFAGGGFGRGGFAGGGMMHAAGGAMHGGGAMRGGGGGGGRHK